MKKIGNILIVFGIISVVFAAGCTSQVNTTGTSTGRAVFAIADAAADIGSVLSIQMTVSSVQIHDTQGWTTVASSPRTYDLLQLKASGNAALLADVNLSEGTYDQMRLDISSIVVADTSGTHEAKLPSKEFKVVGEMLVQANSTSTAVFDFLADQSLHVTGNGQYIFAPVVQVETRSNANVNAASNTNVQITGGNVNTNMRVGMDVSGNVGTGLGIPASANISIGTGGGVVIGGISTGNIGVGIGGGASVNATNVTISARANVGEMVTLYGGETAKIAANESVYFVKYVSSSEDNAAIVIVDGEQASVEAGKSAKVGRLNVFVESVFDFAGFVNDYARFRFDVAGNATGNATVNVTGNAAASGSGGSDY